MKRLPILAALTIVLLLQPWQASAQTWSPQQQEVWGAVQAQWQASMAKDTGWMERFLHRDFRGWTAGEPAPRDKESAGRWARYEMESGSTVVQDLVPMAIVIHGNTAVVHYHYSQAQTDREGKHRTVHGRYTDTLVKENNQWRFLAWSGGAPDAAQ
ncbi:MAG: nuclear transport factor 2 family protein [Longimicrobiaceae bacterium]